MSQQALEIIWYLVFIVVVIGYISLDGFDLGVGALHLFARGDTERRIFLNAIGPVWDGNEVWLVILVGSLFAGFPYAYATMMSAFYIPVMILIAGLIFRAVAIEFRSKRPMKWWRQMWDSSFALGSYIISLGLGLALGNLVLGIPLDVMKTEGELHDRLRGWSYRLLVLYAAFYLALTVYTLVGAQHMIDRLVASPWLFLLAALNVLALLNIAWQLRRRNDGWAFLSSIANIASLVLLYALGTFPNIIRDAGGANSLTISNSYASAATLKILLIIVIIGVPIALAYLASVYYVFKGKVKLDSHSY